METGQLLLRRPKGEEITTGEGLRESGYLPMPEPVDTELTQLHIDVPEDSPKAR